MEEPSGINLRMQDFYFEIRNENGDTETISDEGEGEPSEE